MDDNNKIHLIYVHGGTTFEKEEDYLDFLKNRTISLENKSKWNDRLELDLSNEKVEVVKPKMPLKENARYLDWKIHFEKYLEVVNDNLILIGNSLGGIFLAKYLSENQLNKNIISTYLIAPPFDNTLYDEKLCGGFKLNSDLSMIEKNSKKVTLLFSKTDDIVPVSHAKKYEEKLENSNIIIYEDKNGHFIVPEFKELIDMIKEDINS